MVYLPRQTKDKAGRRAFERVLETFFGGSLEEALAAHPTDAYQTFIHLLEPDAATSSEWGNGTGQLYPSSEWEPGERIVSILPVATDPTARAKFRKYWSLASPGIILIRRVASGLVKADAERRAAKIHAPAA